MKKYMMILAAVLAAACTSNGGGIPSEWPWNDPDADDEQIGRASCRERV